MSIPALFIVTRGILQSANPDKVHGARFLYFFATKLLGRSSPRDFLFLTFSWSLGLTLHEPHHQMPYCDPQLHTGHGLKRYKACKWRCLCLGSKRRRFWGGYLIALWFPAVKPRLTPKIYTMPADGDIACCDMRHLLLLQVLDMR